MQLLVRQGLSISVLAAAVAPSRAQETSLGATLTLASEYAGRGISLSERKLSLQGNLDLSHSPPTRWY